MSLMFSKTVMSKFESAEKPMAFSVNRTLGIVVLSFFTLILISTIIFGFYAFSRVNDNNDYQRLKAENRFLSEKISKISSEIDSLMQKMETMEIWENKIREEQNFNVIDLDIRKMGSGGFPIIDSTLNRYNAPLSVEYNYLITNLKWLKKRVDFNFNTHKELIEQIKLKYFTYASTPSIFPTFGRISERFGWRRHPITNKRSFHYGLDISNRTGTAVYATADGIVKETGRKTKLGRYILISHNLGYETKFGHLHRYIVNRGDEVKKGQIIGYMGSTGRSTGSHLHYEVIKNNKQLNPYYYLNKSLIDIKIVSNE